MARRHKRKSEAYESGRTNCSYCHATYEENRDKGVLLNGCASGCDLIHHLRTRPTGFQPRIRLDYPQPAPDEKLGGVNAEVRPQAPALFSVREPEPARFKHP